MRRVLVLFCCATLLYLATVPAPPAPEPEGASRAERFWQDRVLALSEQRRLIADLLGF
jgi:hypothetical protein